MKKAFKYLIISIIVLVSILVGKVFVDGYYKYKEVVKNVSIEEKVEKIRNDKNYVKFKNIDKDFINAIVSVEDHRFYNHNGIDFIAVTRATINNIKEGKFVQGGSTITQQLAKNLYLDGNKNFSRKVSELFLAHDIEKKYSKDEILEIYSNIINYGNGYIGIKKASEGYFNKSTNDLDMQQASMLAGLPQSPNRYNLKKYYNKAVARQQRVLEAIDRYGNKEYKDNGYLLALDYHIA